jgi:hypothetical protein
MVTFPRSMMTGTRRSPESSIIRASALASRLTLM